MLQTSKTNTKIQCKQMSKDANKSFTNKVIQMAKKSKKMCFLHHYSSSSWKCKLKPYKPTPTHLAE